MRQGAFLIAAAWVAAATVQPVAAQDIYLERGGADPIYRGAAAAAAGTWLDHGDLGAGDNRKDLIVGSPNWSSERGQVTLQFSGPVRTGTLDLASVADATINGVVVGARFGSLTAAGYVFNDRTVTPSALRDLVVAAPGASLVYVFAGPIARGTQDATIARFVIQGQSGERFGASLATVDLNGDGFYEVIVGAPGSDRIYVFNLRGRTPGSLSAASADMVVVADPGLVGQGVGEVIQSGGDVTGDGASDLAIGVPRANGARGAVIVVRGHPRAEGWAFPGQVFLSAVASVIASGVDAGDRAGQSVRLLDVVSSDVDTAVNPAIRDLVIGAPGGDGPGNGRPDAGEVYFLWGGSLVPNCNPHTTTCVRSLGSPDVVAFGATAGARTGERLAGGDINRDRPDDVVFIAPGTPGGVELQVRYGRRTRAGYGSVLDLATPGRIDRRVIGANIDAALVYELTGEGANDIVAGVSSADAGRGLVYVAISPKLQLSTRSATYTVSQCATPSTAITVRNPSLIALPWEARLRGAWLRVAPAVGSSIADQPASLRVVATTAGLAPGSYTGSVEVWSTSEHVDMFVRVEVTLTVQAASPLAANAGVDFTGDGCGDAVVFRPSSGTWHVPGESATQLGARGDLPVPGDYNGDRRADAAAYRPSTGDWLFAGSTVHHGEPGDWPVPADYDGDGFTDIAVFTPSTATWSVRGQPSVQWGQRGDVPVPADYDGDGDADIAVYRRASGTWLIRGGTSVQWGGGYDVPVPADYNGDGRDDIGVYSRAHGMWRIKDQFTMQLGSDGDLPVPLDADRDGRGDLVLFQRSTGRWLVHSPATQLTSTIEGGARGDMPVFLRPYLVFGAVTDFTADGLTDLVWQHDDGRLAVWQMNGTALERGVLLDSRVSDGSWRVSGAGDFNRDGQPDILWQHADGRVVIWLMNGTTLIQGILVTRASDVQWRIAATGDLDGDGHVDIIWQHPSGWVAVWLMNGTAVARGAMVTPEPISDPAWFLAAAGDADGDGKLDLFWHHRTAGHVVVWIMNGTTLAAGRMSPTNIKDPNWRIVGAGDVNGDGYPDLLWQHQNGFAVAWLMEGERLMRGAALMQGVPSDTGWRLSGPR